jgi:hypothetical protein
MSGRGGRGINGSRYRLCLMRIKRRKRSYFLDRTGVGKKQRERPLVEYKGDEPEEMYGDG